MNIEATSPKAINQTIALSANQRALGRMIDLDLSNENNQANQPVAQDLGRDAFWQLYMPTPTVKPTDEIPENRKLNRRLLDWVEKSPAWEGSRAKAMGSALVSAASAPFLWEVLTSDDAIQEALKAEEAAQKQEEAAKEAQEASDQAKAAGDKAAAEAYQKQAKNHQDAAQASRQAASHKMDKIENSLEEAGVRSAAISKAGEKAEKVSAMATGWGIDPGAVQAADVAEILKTMEDYKSFLEKITAKIGRVKGIAVNVRSSHPKKDSIVIASDGYTQKMQNIFPGELAYLRSDAPAAMRAETMGRYCDHGLVGLIPGNENIEEGALVLAVDRSGSMAVYDRLIKATALALGIAESAKETQKFTIFGFSDSSYNYPTITSDNTPTERIMWAAEGTTGGTDFDAALNHAMDVVSGMPEEDARGADIGILTDGEAGINPETASRYREMRSLLGTRLIYLQVGSKADLERYPDLTKLASAVLAIGDKEDIDGAAEQLAEALVRQPASGD